MDINKILEQYTACEITLVEANQALKEAKSKVLLDITQNTLTEEDKRATTIIGYYPEQSNGWGLLDISKRRSSCEI